MMDQWHLALALGCTGVSFPAYYFLAKQGRISAAFSRNGHSGPGTILHITVQRLLGFFFLGLLPLVLILILGTPLSAFGLAPPSIFPWWLALLASGIIAMGYFAAGTTGNQAMYPQIRAQSWSPALLGSSALTWLLFLLGYEFLFRGYLLFSSAALLGTWPAIALNCSLYALAHMYKGPGETFGAIPVGLLLCWLSLESGSFFTAFLLHAVMALSNEWWSIRRNPEMKVIWRQRS